MLLRIFLILAILAGLGTILLSQLKLRPHVQQIIDTRDENKRNWDTQLSRANKLDKELKDTKGKLAQTTQELDETKVNLASTTTKYKSELDRANGLQKKLESATTRANNAEAELAAWNALGVKVNEVKALVESERKLRDNNEALEAEKKILAKKNKELEDMFTKVFGADGPPPPVAPGVRGKVLAVDPKYDFVVLDIGDSEGIRPRAILLVSRNSKLVAKVQVSSVEGNRSVANILPGWKIGEVFEGDVVLAN
jgi:hypothetical protein